MIATAGTASLNTDLANGVVVVNGGVFTPDAGNRQVKGFVYNSGTPNTANSIAVNKYIGGTNSITSAMLAKLSNNGVGLFAGDPTGPLSNTGKLGTLTIGANYALNNNGTFYFTINGGGNTPGTDLGTIAIATNLTLTGPNATVVAYNPNVVTPAATNTFLTYAGSLTNNVTTWSGKIINATNTLVNWTGTAGDNLWVTGDNWDLVGYNATVDTSVPGQISLVTGTSAYFPPLAGSDVTIATGNPTVTGPAAALSLNTLTLGNGSAAPALILQTGGALTVANAVTVNAGSALTAGDSALSAGSLVLNGGTATLGNASGNVGVVTVETGGALTLNQGTISALTSYGGATSLNGGTVTTFNARGGTDVIAGAGVSNLTLNATSGTFNATSGTIASFTVPGTDTVNPVVGAGVALANATINASNIVGAVALGNTNAMAGLTVQGVVVSHNGNVTTLTVSGGSYSSAGGAIGTATVTTGGGLTTVGGAINSFSHSGSGVSTIGTNTPVTTAAVADGLVNFSSVSASNGTLTLAGGTVNFGGGARVAVADFSAVAGIANALNPVGIATTAKFGGLTCAYTAGGGATFFTAGGSNIVVDSVATPRTLALSGGTLSLTVPSGGGGPINGLLRHYTFDDPANNGLMDSSTNGITGTGVGSLTRDTTTTKFGAGAMKFNNTSSYFIPGNTSGTAAQLPASGWTFTTWFNTVNFTGGYRAMLHCGTTYHDNKAYPMIAYSSYNSPYGIYNNGGWSSPASGSTAYFPSVNATVDATSGWHFMAITYDGTTLKHYIDGTVTPTGSLTATQVGTFYVGSINDDDAAAGHAWAQYLDDVYLYNRPLSTNELNSIYINADPAPFVLTFSNTCIAATASSTLSLGGVGSTNTLGKVLLSGAGTVLTVTNASNLAIGGLTVDIPGGGVPGKILTGAVTLNITNATLAFTGAAPAVPVIVLIDTTGGVAGHFRDGHGAEILEGAKVTVNGASYTISYEAGPDGKDVVLKSATSTLLIVN